MNFPALVAHPGFRPVKLKDRRQHKLEASGDFNGAFSLAATESAALLERADTTGTRIK